MADNRIDGGLGNSPFQNFDVSQNDFTSALNVALPANVAADLARAGAGGSDPHGRLSTDAGGGVAELSGDNDPFGILGLDDGAGGSDPHGRLGAANVGGSTLDDGELSELQDLLAQRFATQAGESDENIELLFSPEEEEHIRREILDESLAQLERLLQEQAPPPQNNPPAPPPEEWFPPLAPEEEWAPPLLPPADPEAPEDPENPPLDPDLVAMPDPTGEPKLGEGLQVVGLGGNQGNSTPITFETDSLPSGEDLAALFNGGGGRAGPDNSTPMPSEIDSGFAGSGSGFETITGSRAGPGTTNPLEGVMV